MQKNGPLGYLTLVLVSLILVVLGIFTFQLNTIEERFIQQSQQVRALGESSDRLAGRIERLVDTIESGGLQTSNAPRASRDRHADVDVLHPEIPNALEEEEIFWPAPGANMEGILRKGYSGGDPKGFNPVTENAADVAALRNYVESSLARRMAWSDPDRWTGDLAWRVEISPDYREYTFYLKRGIKWHTPSGVDLDDPQFAWLAGEHLLTAHDFVFSLDMTMNPQVENGFAKSYYQDLESWEAKGDYVLVVRWKKKVQLSKETSLGLGPLPEFLWAFDKTGERFPDETLGLRFNQHWYNNKGIVGTGPYRFARYEPGAQIRLVRNEDFHGVKPAIKELRYSIYTDPNKTLLLLKAHEIDFAGLRPGDYREEVLKWRDVDTAERPGDNPFASGEIHCQKELDPVYYYIGWNANKPLFADKLVRRAMTMALNRQGIIDNVFVGLGSISTGPFLSNNPGNDPSIQPYPFDLESAAALLAEAGWEDTDGDGLVDKDLSPDDGDPARSPFAFKLLTYGNSPEYSSMANIFKEDLLKLGVKLDVDRADWSLMQKKMEEKAFDAFTGGWGMSWESDPYQLWHSSQADIPRGSNRIGFRDPEADALIDQLRETFEPEDRQPLLRRFHAIMHEEQPYSFFRYRVTPYCWWNNVKDVVFAKLGPNANSVPWSVAPTP